MSQGIEDPFTKLMETPPFFDSWYTWIAIFLVAVLAGFRLVLYFDFLLLLIAAINYI